MKDLNGPDKYGETYAGVPAIFKQFTLEAGLTDYDVSSELVGGKGLEYWFTVPDTLARINKPWDVVVMHGFSTLDQAHPGDKTLLLSVVQAHRRDVPEGQPQGQTLSLRHLEPRRPDLSRHGRAAGTASPSSRWARMSKPPMSRR